MTASWFAVGDAGLPESGLTLIYRTSGAMTEQNSRSKTHVKAVAVFAVVLAVIVAGLHYGQRIITHLGLGNQQRIEVEGSENWAEPVEMDGVENFHRVSEELCRGAQPTAEGMVNLHKAGVRTVVNLRKLHSDRDELGQTDLRYEHITMTTWHPEEKEVIRFLEIVSDPNAVPVFVHCQRGADRTGTMCAVYRIVVQGWSKQQALDEMTKGGFGFYEGWDELVECIEQLDVEGLRAHIAEH